MEQKQEEKNWTIVAAATAAVRSGVAVVRISGGLSLSLAKKLSGRDKFFHRAAQFCVIDTGEIRDESLIIYFGAPFSYTGEDVVEIHCHGNPLIVSEIIRFCINNGARLAEAGEFTRRAYLNGKTDLASAEAVLDIISARTSLQLSSAMSQRSGDLSKRIEDIQGQILDILAELNAAIDYPEEDIEAVSVEEATKKAGILAGSLRELGKTYQSGRLIREGVRLAIYGAPNVGKSSLLNCLLGKERAIVSDIAGTTRDTVEDSYEYGGMLFVATDTAGIRETGEAIERLGIQRTQEAVKDCDIVLAVSDETGNFAPPPEGKAVIYIRNKADLLDSKSECGKCVEQISNISENIAKNTSKSHSSNDNVVGGEVIEVSALYGKNIEIIKQRIFDLACKDMVGGFALTNLRHFQAVMAAADYLFSASSPEKTTSPEIVSIDLYDAANELGKITGLIGSDEVISRIFSKFCVGK